LSGGEQIGFKPSPYGQHISWFDPPISEHISPRHTQLSPPTTVVQLGGSALQHAGRGGGGAGAGVCELSPSTLLHPHTDLSI
tara:strand:+ start:945 stop:1190 length:246 start_codon:yes stop_codon:yes gene_type:complete